MNGQSRVWQAPKSTTKIVLLPSCAAASGTKPNNHVFEATSNRKPVTGKPQAETRNQDSEDKQMLHAALQADARYVVFVHVQVVCIAANRFLAAKIDCEVRD